MAYGLLDIQITQGVDAAIPIAIYPFYDAATTLPASEQAVLETVVLNDLKTSGFFSPTLASGPTPDSISNVSYQALSAAGNEYLILGRVRRAGQGLGYDVSFELIDIYQSLRGAVSADRNRADSKPQVVILERLQFDVQPKDIRALAHRISDIVYQKLTGIPGIFSTRIAYVNVIGQALKNKRYILEVADVDGYNPRPLVVSTEPVMSPSWHPKADRIAYVSFVRHRAEVHVVTLSTGRDEVVSAFAGINGAPSWSPDGSKLAMVLSKEGSPKIYLYDLVTHNLQKLTEGSSIDTEPRWLADGRGLIFTSNRGGTPQIYRYDFSDRKVTRLTYQGDYNARGTLTADGQKLVMFHRNMGRFNIAVQDLRDDSLKILTRANLDESPCLSPNGQYVLYASYDGLTGRGILQTVSIDGRVQLKLPARNGDVQEPSWAPFG
jgi:TolB protein